MKVMITGANGQLGWELQQSAPQEVELIPLDRHGLDITDANAVNACINDYQPQQLINCAAYTAVDKAETEVAAARAINAKGAANLATACHESGCRMLQISTDFIFDGTRSTPYPTDAAANPLGIYGLTKWEGEELVRKKSHGAALILRTSWVYSTHGNNFVKTMLRLMQERDQLGVVDDQIGSPSWAHNIANTLWALTEKPELTGTVHYSDNGIASWYDFAVAIQEEAIQAGLLKQPIPIKAIPGSAYPTPAQRPAYSVLDKQKTWEALGYQAPHWRDALRKMLCNFK